MKWFLPNYLRGRSNRDIAEVALKSAESLFEIFSNVWMTLGQTAKVPRGNRKFPVLTPLNNFTQAG